MKNRIMIVVLSILAFVISAQVSVNAEELESNTIVVGGVEVTDTNASDVFNDGKVSYDKESNTLTLNGYEYEGEGYIYDTYEDEENGEIEVYSAAIFSDGDLNVKLIGNNTIVNTFKGSSNYGDGIVSNNNLTLNGDGKLSSSAYYALYSVGDMIINGCEIYLYDSFDPITSEKNLLIKDAKIYIDAECDGIYAVNNIDIIDSDIKIIAEVCGIYSYDGIVSIKNENPTVSNNGPWVIGTKIDIKVEKDYAFFGYAGIDIQSNLMFSYPEKAEILKFYNVEKDYEFYSIFVGENIQKEIIIEPVVCYVDIIGLNHEYEVIVPIGKSVNEMYCSMYDINDFSEIIDVEKTDYTFVGWYTDLGCTDGHEFSFDNQINESITIYPKWTHEHSGGEATCKNKAVCSICNESYGELGEHSYKNGVCDVCSDILEPEAPVNNDNVVWYIIAAVASCAIIITVIAFVVVKKKKTN